METAITSGFVTLIAGLAYVSNQLKRIEFLLQKLVDDKDPNQWPPSS